MAVKYGRCARAVFHTASFLIFGAGPEVETSLVELHCLADKFY